MNYFSIFSMLTPKIEVGWLYEDFTLRQAYEKLLQWNFSAMPIIDGTGEYKGILFAKDLLKYLEILNVDNVKDMEQYKLTDVNGIYDTTAIKCNTSFEKVVNMLENQNFIPVVDDREKFIGIITRRSLIECLYNKCLHLEEISMNSNILPVYQALRKLA